jgi:hypothetical protein
LWKEVSLHVQYRVRENVLFSGALLFEIGLLDNDVTDGGAMTPNMVVLLD